MRAKLKIVAKYAGYGCLTLLLTAYFAVITFPFDTVKDRLLTAYAGDLPFQLSLGDVEATPLLWLRATDVRIRARGDTAPGDLLTLQELRLRPSPFALITGRPAASLQGDLYGGTIHGHVGRAKQRVEVDLAWEGLRLDKHPGLPGVGDAKAKGGLSGRLVFAAPPNRWFAGEGDLTCRLTDGGIEGLQVYGFTVPPLQGFTGNAELRLEKQKAMLEAFTLDGQGLTASVSGSADLQQRAAATRLNLKGKLKLSGALATQYDAMLAGFLRNTDAEGFRTFSLRGTLARPRFSL